MPNGPGADFSETLQLSINAWTGEGEAASGKVGPGWKAWLWSDQKVPDRMLAADDPVDIRKWSDPEVGWGVVLRDTDEWSEADKAVARDAPDAIQRLLEARPESPVFRYRPDGWDGMNLRVYYPDSGSRDVALTGGARGAEPGKLPYYLLICGGPEEIPWEVQYLLNLPCCVGRLALPDAALNNYVDHLIDGWSDSPVTPRKPVVWSVDHGSHDITRLMRQAVAEPVLAALRGDGDIGDEAIGLLRAEATAGRLVETLRERHPALIVTTSHGKTGPLYDSDTMARDLGLLVDASRATVGTDDLLQDWDPDGTLWYAHACCSAGSDTVTRYDGLIEEGTDVDRILKAVAGLGARVSPLPSALLAASKPARAFVGHVEPTFDWTLERPDTRQIITEAITQALYNRMHRVEPEPVGLAFRGFYREVGELLAQWHRNMKRVDAGEFEARQPAMQSLLAALDRQSLVILGDPTVALPALG